MDKKYKLIRSRLMLPLSEKLGRKTRLEDGYVLIEGVLIKEAGRYTPAVGRRIVQNHGSELQVIGLPKGRDLVEENILGEQNGTRFFPKAKDDGVSAAKPHLLEGASQWILLLPGSRLRAYEDVALLLATAECLGERCVAKRDTAVPRFLLVVAPTLESPRLVAEATRRGWAERRIFRRGRNVLVLEKEKSWGRLSVELSDESVAKVASGARLVIGLGGTANQICAGLGVPVVSILEKGKLVQKKLLRDAEVLVPPSPEDLSEAAERILEDATLHAAMSDAGRRAMGRPGALGDVETYAAECLGWALRHDVYKELCAFLAKEELK